MAGYLGDLSCWCNEIGAPMISSLVINENKNEPGNGFYRLYEELKGVKVHKDEQMLVFLAEVKKCSQYKKWNEFKFFIGI